MGTSEYLGPTTARNKKLQLKQIFLFLLVLGEFAFTPVISLPFLESFFFPLSVDHLPLPV
jgi:hypothetical protein